MKTYSYLICGDATLNSINAISDELESNKIDGVSFSFSSAPFSVIATVDEKIVTLSTDEIEAMLIPIFEKQNLQIVLPANTKHFSYVGEPKTKNEKKYSPRAMIIAIAVTLVVSVLFTYVFASGIMKTPSFNTSAGADVIDISDATDQVEILNKIFAQYEFDYDNLDKDVLTDALLKAYVEASGDKYAIYYNAEEYADWQKSQEGTSAGIGVIVTKSKITVNDEAITVVEILYVNQSSPAKAAGINIGDCIYAINQDGKQVLVNSVGYDEATDLLLGEEGTVADISVYRKNEAGDYTSIDFSITRAEYESDTVLGSVCETDSRVGVVKLLSFGLKTPKQFSKVVDELLAQGCEYFIFDLRSNPGGDLNAIKAILSYFLNEGDLILSVEYSDGTKNEHFVTTTSFDENSSYYGCSITKDDIGKYKNLKFNVLTDESTASAAELFTATVRDYELGRIIGEARTYGKGCMQTILPLTSYGIEGGLRVTTSMYFSKSHTVYHNIGIVPDIIEPLNEEAEKFSTYNLPHEKDNQLQVAINDLLK